MPVGSRRRWSPSGDPLGEAARLEALGDLPGALAVLVATGGSHGERWAVRQSRGQLRARLGDPGGAVGEFEGALAVRPEDPRSLRGLGAALGELGRSDEAARALARAIASAPSDPEGYVALGALALAEGRLDEARARLGEALERKPDHPEALANLGRVRSRQGEHSEAIAALDRAYELLPAQPMLAVDAALARIAAGAEAEAEAFVARALQRHPGHAGLLMAQALAWGGQGKHAEVRRLHRLHRFVSSRRLDVDPRGLVPELLSDPTLTRAPLRHATRGGQHSGAIDPRRRPALAPLIEWIEQGLRAYIRELPDIVHPFVRARPRQLGLQLWSVVLHEGGHQVPHIHPEAWVSGVFYVEVPPAPPDDPSAGGLRFGEVDPDVVTRARFEHLDLRPEPGMLVIFPSYLWHRTLDFRGPGRRLSVAFDAVGER